MRFETKLTKIGTSIAPIIPQELRKKWNLEDKEEVVVEIWKKGDLTSIFGKLKGTDANELNNIADKDGWN